MRWVRWVRWVRLGRSVRSGRTSADKMFVPMTEPMTLATDYLLGTLSEVLGILLVVRNRALQQRSIALWAFGLMAVATASYAGGTYHGFHDALGASASAMLWKITTFSMGAASFLFLASALTAAFAGGERRLLVGAAAVKFIVYAAWMLRHDDFVYVIYEYGSTLVIVLVLALTRRTRGVEGHEAALIGGVLVSFAAAGVQQSGVRLHEHFNHNDLMHVIQMGGVWLLFRGGAGLRDAGGLDDRP